jgi:hypothetical protein
MHLPPEHGYLVYLHAGFGLAAVTLIGFLTKTITPALHV